MAFSSQNYFLGKIIDSTDLRKPQYTNWNEKLKSLYNVFTRMFLLKMEFIAGHCSTQKLPITSHPIHLAKTKFMLWVFRIDPTFSSLTSSPSRSHMIPSVTTTLTILPSIMLGAVLLQGIHTCYSVCLEQSFPL